MRNSCRWHLPPAPPCSLLTAQCSLLTAQVLTRLVPVQRQVPPLGPHHPLLYCALFRSLSLSFALPQSHQKACTSRPACMILLACLTARPIPRPIPRPIATDDRVLRCNTAVSEAQKNGTNNATCTYKTWSWCMPLRADPLRVTQKCSPRSALDA